MIQLRRGQSRNLTAARIKAPVLWICMSSSSAISRVQPTAAKSMACPPTMPREPAASARVSTMARRPLASSLQGGIVGENVKRQGMQGIAGQDRRCLIKGTVTSGFSAPQIIVIHGGQVIMDQGVGMNEFHRAGRSVQGIHAYPQCRAGGVDQDGPDPLTAAQDGVAHGFMESGRVQSGCQAANGPGRVPPWYSQSGIKARRPADGIILHRLMA